MDEIHGVGELGEQRQGERIVRLEVECEGVSEPVGLEVVADDAMLVAIRDALALGPDVMLFERDGDEPLTAPIEGRNAVRLVAHCAKQIAVTVRYEHRSIERDFAPSKTVFKVLQWAVGKQGFGLDPTLAAKANLILPGAKVPLPRDSIIGSHTQAGVRELVLDLTFRDFTNG